MTKHHGALLVDTNVILECHRVGAWQALSNGYSVETTEVCIEETQTGIRKRQRLKQIDARDLRKSLKMIHPVRNREFDSSRKAIQIGINKLDAGETSLWIHILTRNDDWILCGPDKASLRCGVRLGFREKLVSLERLLIDVGHQPKIPLRRAYTDKWLRVTLSELVVAQEA